MKLLDKIKMCTEVQRYTVQAFDERFIIMTKPFNIYRTYLYTIADLERGVRGPTNHIFGPGLVGELNEPEGAAQLLKMLQTGDCAVTYRHDVDLTENELAQLRA